MAQNEAEHATKEAIRQKEHAEIARVEAMKLRDKAEEQARKLADQDQEKNNVLSEHISRAAYAIDLDFKSPRDGVTGSAGEYKFGYRFEKFTASIEIG